MRGRLDQFPGLRNHINKQFDDRIRMSAIQWEKSVQHFRRLTYPDIKVWYAFNENSISGDTLLAQIKNELLVIQNGKCPICSIQLDESNIPHLDHDPDSNEIRGLLCSNCNIIILGCHNLQTIEIVEDYLHKPPFIILKNWGPSLRREIKLWLIKLQENKCAICNELLPDYKSSHLDHEKETRKIRGVLCSFCNTKLVGNHTLESLETLKDYLINYPAKQLGIKRTW